MSKLKHKINWFKGENGFVRLFLVIICIALLVQILFLPTHIEFLIYGFSWFGFYGLHFFYGYNTGEFRWFFFGGDLLHTIPIITAIIIFLILALKLNKLKRSVKLLLGITNTILFLLNLIIYPLMSIRYCLNCIPRFFFTSILLILLYAAMTLVLTFHISRKNNNPGARTNKNGHSRKKQQFEPSIVFVQRLIIVFSILLIMQFFIPTFIGLNYYSTPAKVDYVHFFSGVIINRFGTDYSIDFDPLSLLQTIPVIAALFLLIILIVKNQALKRKTQMKLGIASSFLLALSPILYYGIYFSTQGPIAPVQMFSCFNLHFLIICIIFIFLGMIHISKKSISTEN